ncbi:hypothetical protein Unana1_07766 [Umbelopsis nana]
MQHVDNSPQQKGFNSFFQFIRPSHHSQRPHHGLHIDTNSLGINFHPSDSRRPSIDEDKVYGSIYKELSFPHDRQRHTSDDCAGFSRLPDLSPSSSASSVTSTNDPHGSHTLLSPIALPVRHQRQMTSPGAATRRCEIIRRSNTLPSSHHPVISPIGVSASSWGNAKSPAASFLSSFASPAEPTYEFDGDEIGDYVLGKTIGHGGFSTVREGFRISDGKKVAIKVTNKTVEVDERENHRVQMRLEREITIWKSLEHPNIVQYLDALETDYATYVVSEYCPNGTLLDLLIRANASHTLTEDMARPLIIQLCSALTYLHEKVKVCHKDLKLENILFDELGNLKLCDFGLSEYQNPTHANQSPSSPFAELDQENDSTAGGSLAYTAPEQLCQNHPIRCSSSDIWSLGVCLYTLIAGRLPFVDEYKPRMEQQIRNGQYTMPENISPQLEQLIKQCFELNPELRLTARQVLQSDWCAM